MAIEIVPGQDPSWYKAPPYAVAEVVFDECITRIYGLSDKDTQVWRVVGVFTPVPFADADRGRIDQGRHGVTHDGKRNCRGGQPRGAASKTST